MHSPSLVSVSSLLALGTLLLLPHAASGSPDLGVRLSAQLGARAATVSGPIISVTPSSFDFGRVNVGETSPASQLMIRNDGDATLTITGVTHTGSGFSAVAGSLSIDPGASTTLSTAYTPSGSGPQSDNVSIQSNATNGTFLVLLRGTANNAPVFSPALAQSYALAAFVPFSLVASAIDPEGDHLSWSMTSLPPLPVGANFDNAGGALAWTPVSGDGGSYAVTITVSDGLASTEAHTTLQVSDSNHPPTANAGGPYRGGATLPVTFDGSRSSDPDVGQTLTYSWDFGDGSTGLGVTPSHAYAYARDYLVSLRVTDNGSPPLSATALTSVQIVDFVPVTIVQPYGADPVIKPRKRFTFGIECYVRPLTEINVASMRLSTTYPNAGPLSEVVVPVRRGGIRIADIHRNLFYDLDFEVNPRGLLDYVPKGTKITLVFTAKTIEKALPIPVYGTIDLRVQSVDDEKDAGPVPVLTATPNPSRPATTVRFSVEEAGPVSIRIYSTQGRLVRTLREGENTEAGIHQVPWDGLSDAGIPVGSGIYLVKTTAGDRVSTLKLAIMK